MYYSGDKERTSILFAIQFLLTICLLCASSFYMVRSYYIDEVTGFISYALLILAICTGIATLFKRFYVEYDASLKFALVYSILVLVFNSSYLLSSRLTVSINCIINIIAIPLGLIMGQWYGQKLVGKKTEKISLFLLTLPIICSAYALMSSPYIEADTIFIILFFFPLVYLLRNKAIKTAYYIALLIFCIMSAKRSAIIAAGFLGLILICSFSAGDDRKGSFSRVSKILAILILVICSIFAVGNYSEEVANVVSRFSTIADSGGSGRADIYEHIYKSYQSSSFSEQLFGHGYHGVLNNIGISAHNDFLEILYDFGICAAIIYILFFFSILKQIFILLKKRIITRGSMALCGATVNLVILGMMNCVISNSLYIMITTFIVGISSTINKYE